MVYCASSEGLRVKNHGTFRSIFSTITQSHFALPIYLGKLYLNFLRDPFYTAMEF
jgi:hypothetical protein